jgi:hypothetical protein
LTEKTQYPVDIQQIEHGLKILQHRKWNLMVSAVVLSSVGIIKFVSFSTGIGF